MDDTRFDCSVLTLREIKPASFNFTRTHLEETVHSEHYYSKLTTQYFMTMATHTILLPVAICYAMMYQLSTQLKKLTSY
jgi:hypothetical protein